MKEIQRMSFLFYRYVLVCTNENYRKLKNRLPFFLLNDISAAHLLNFLYEPEHQKIIIDFYSAIQRSQ